MQEKEHFFYKIDIRCDIFMGELEWVECKECIYFQEGDCEDFYTKCDGCYFGMTEQDILNEESAAADYNKK